MGCQLFGPLLQERVEQIDREFQARPGQRLIGRRPLRVATLFGEVRLERDYYLSPREGGHCPADAALGLEGSATPALARLLCRAAAQQPYGAASRDLAEYGEIRVEERQIQRAVQGIAPAVAPWLETLPQSQQSVPVLYVSCDGTGTPMRAEELRGRKGRQPDGTARTRAVKLGAVFTQHRTDEEGHPVRDYQSTSYGASYAPAGEFAHWLRAEARRRGVGSAGPVVFLSDGAAWAEDLGDRCFAGAVSLLDFYHAAQRVPDLSTALGGAKAAARASRWKKWLLRDQVAKVIAQARELQTQGAEDPVDTPDHLGFLEGHPHRMRSGTYRQRGWFIGRGVVEAGCKTVIGKRLKQSGMFWSETGATAVVQLRTLLLSQRFDAFWADRLNAHAARNDSLALSA